jgi:DNA polymerase-3 subunit alpha
VAIFKLDDKTGAIESVVAEELLNAHAALLKDDEVLILQGKAQPDRFSGGVRFNVQQIWDLPTARCRHGRYLRVPANGQLPPVEQMLRDFPARRTPIDADESEVTGESGERVQGLPIRLVIERERATAEIDLGEAARFYPSDEALKAWQVGSHGQARLVYADESA